MKEATIPFSGFYESVHDSLLDDALTQMVADDQGDVPEFTEGLWEHVDWRKVHEDYAKEYVEAFVEEFNSCTGLKIPMTLVVVDSPREYNFTTDRIFVNISEDSIRKMWKAVDKAELDKLIRERFTSYSGFSSFYDNSLEAWLAVEQRGWDKKKRKIKVTDWDHNQLGTLIECLWEQCHLGSREGVWREHELMEHAIGNGVLDNLIYDNMDEEGRAIVKRAYQVNYEDDEQA